MSPADRESFEMHLKSCAGCSSEYRGLLMIHEVLMSRRFDAPPGLDTRIIRSLPERARAGEAGGFWSAHPVIVRFAGALTLAAFMATGAISGSFLAESLMAQNNQNYAANGFAAVSLSLDVFSPAPQDSIVGAGLVTEGSDE